MLNITPQMQRDIGEGVITIVDGVLYLTDGRSWILAAPHPDGLFDPQVLELVRQFDTKSMSRVLDWRILHAKHVDYTNETFLPYRARKYAPLSFDTYRSFSSLRNSDLQDAFVGYEPSIYGDHLVNLEEIFAAGNARAIYKENAEQRKKKEGRVFAKEDSADSYIFRFNDKIIGAAGAQFRCLREMGFVAYCPPERYGNKLAVPPIGLRWNNGFDVFGVTMPMSSLGVFEDNQGRKLFADAGVASWRTEQECLETLCAPSSYSFHEDEAMTLGDVLDQSWNYAALKQDVSALMWKGWPVEEIDRIYEDGRYAAYLQQAEGMQVQIREYLEEINSDTPAWRIRNIESDLQRFCNTYERMTHLVEFELGMLPEAIERLGKVLNETETTSMTA